MSRHDSLFLFIILFLSQMWGNVKVQTDQEVNPRLTVKVTPLLTDPGVPFLLHLSVFWLSSPRPSAFVSSRLFAQTSSYSPAVVFSSFCHPFLPSFTLIFVPSFHHSRPLISPASRLLKHQRSQRAVKPPADYPQFTSPHNEDAGCCWCRVQTWRRAIKGGL